MSARLQGLDDNRSATDLLDELIELSRDVSGDPRLRRRRLQVLRELEECLETGHRPRSAAVA